MRFLGSVTLLILLSTSSLSTADHAITEATLPPANKAFIAQTTPTQPATTQQAKTVATATPAGSITASINGIPLETLLLMTEPTKLNVQQIFSKGQQLGNDPLSFTAIGDSSIAGGQFLSRFGKGDYKLGNYTYLQDVINAFAPSFARQSTAVRVGLHSWSVMNPAWADKSKCKPNESVIACEFRLHKPSIVFIRLGVNDAAAKLFDKSMRQVVEYSIENGVIPVLITKADQRRGTESVNNSLRQIASDYKVPILEFGVLAATLPGRGLGKDGVHMTGFPKNDYTLPTAFKSGHAMHNLAALLALNALWREVTSQPAQTGQR